MQEMVIRTTMKFVYIWYLVVALFVVASLIVLERVQWPDWIPQAVHPWLPFLPILLIWIPFKRHLRNRLTRMTLLDDRLRYETGFMSRTTRTIQLSNVQDVTVHQSFGQRLVGVGDVSIETSGKSSRETIFNVDKPQEIADRINDRSPKGPAAAPAT